MARNEGAQSNERTMSLREFGLEGLVSEHRDRSYRGGRQKHWIKGISQALKLIAQANVVVAIAIFFRLICGNLAYQFSPSN